ncbi:fibrinogen-like protein 1-like protein [Mantella aurantiaca]
MLGSKLWTVGWLFLSGVTFAASEEAAQPAKGKSLVENSHMIENISDAINYDELRQRKVFFTRDCEELYQLGHRKSGVYVIRPEGSPYLVVQCLMHDCGGWTVVQRNSFDTPIAWSESWTAYEFGFGDITSDHYLGNKYIHLLTTQKWNKVRFLLVDADNKTRHADYDSFSVTAAADQYRLRLGTYEGDAGDSMTGLEKNLHDNMRFSTHDRDNDRQANDNCANAHGGGWWYDSCYDALLNRKNGLHWQTLCQSNCRHSAILIRPVHMYCHRV